MKLLFDQNLSFKLCSRLDDLFPGSSQVRLLGFDQATDREIWEFARANEFAIVTQDADYADLSALYGSPPHVIWLRCGNQPTSAVADLIRANSEAIASLGVTAIISCLEVA